MKSGAHNFMNILDEQDFMVAVSNFLSVLEQEGRIKKTTRLRVSDAIVQRRLDWYNKEKANAQT